MDVPRPPLLPVLACLLTTGCGDPEPVQVFRYADSEPEFMDPGLCAESACGRLLPNLFEGLTVLAPDDGPPRPGVARSWEVEQHDTLWTFHLRDDATWSDGTPVTAHDFEYAWQRVADPATGSKVAQYTWYLTDGRQVSAGELAPEHLGVRALDDHTLMVELDAPTHYLLELLATPGFAPVPRHVVEREGSRWVRPENIVVNGPYLLTEWVPLDHITLERNGRYHSVDTVAIERVDVRIIDDAATRYKLYVAGDIDWLFSVPHAYIPRLKHSRDDFHIADSLATYYYMCNTERPPLDDPQVRHALNLAIDKEAIVHHITKGDERPARNVVPRLPGYDGPYGGEFDPARARELLAAAGYPGGAGFPLLEITSNAMDMHRLIAEAIQGMWREHLAIEASLDTSEWTAYLHRQQVGDFHVARSGWAGDYRDPMAFLEPWYCDGSNNHTGYCEPAFDALLNQARAEADPDRRHRQLRQAEEILLRDLPLIPVFHYTMPYLLAPDIRGYEENLLDVHLLRYLHRGS